MSTHTRRPKRSPRLSFDVTEEDIRAGMPRDSGHCMIADALARSYPNTRYISVDLQTVRFTDLNAGVRWYYFTPRNAQLALLDFDQGDHVPDPFHVNLRRAFQMRLSGSAGRSQPRTSSDVGSGSSTQHAELVQEGGKEPPLAALAGGAPRNRYASGSNHNPKHGAGSGNRKGKRREFGLRALVR